MSYGFQEDKFFIDFNSCTRSVDLPRSEFAERARTIHKKYSNLILSFSGGIDSQATFLAFKDANINIPCAFMHLPGYNDNEYENTLLCVKKWNIDLHVIKIDPYEVKDQIIAESNRLQIPPNQILHTIFVNKLPKKYTLVEGFNGPDPYVHNGKHYLMESANSVEYARLRAYKTLCKARTVVGFEKDEYILLSILKDDILTSMCNSWNYYNIKGLSFLDEDPISVINYWDLFIKPIFYGRHWGNDLVYVPKYQGCEKIDFIVNGMEHRYKDNQIFINIEEIVDFLENGKGTKRYWQRNPS